MRTWKKVVIGGLAGVTLGGGANMAAMAATRGDNPARQEGQAGDIRREDRQADHDQNEERGREAEGENAAGDVQHENEAQEAEGRNNQEGDDNSGPRSDNSGPGSADSGPGSGKDDSSHHGRDDG
jgi:hypothetical protein